MLIQRDLFQPSVEQQFEAWKSTPGGRHVLRYAYRFAASYAREFQRTGQKVSMKLIWELMRHRMRLISARCAQLGVRLEAFNGYALNNVFTAYIARHIMARRPEWSGMFETREIGVERRSRRVVVIEETKTNTRKENGL